ncbi:MAG TPA: hypothetical protein VFW38_07800 [Solirubrobacteraceae bacterium]|nr:hypothetical protein [Solirubrobacteraceae bacterium]
MSKITVTVPAQVAVLLRGALHMELIRACEDAPGAKPESVTRACWTPVLSRMGAAFRGLDLIGWDEPEEQQPVTIALDRTMIEALETDAEMLDWLSEQEKSESAEGRARAARRAATIERFLASLSERRAAATLMIPTAALPLIRECAYEGIPMVSEAIDRGVDPRECSRRLDAISDMLDAIDWSEDEQPTEDVDAAEHAGTVKEVAPAIMATLTTAVRELDDGDPEKPKNEDELRLLSELYAQARKVLGE